MKIVIIILIVVVLIVMALFVVGMFAVIGAQEDIYREFDDREQEEYIRKWQEKQKARKQRR